MLFKILQLLKSLLSNVLPIMQAYQSSLQTTVVFEKRLCEIFLLSFLLFDYRSLINCLLTFFSLDLDARIQKSQVRFTRTVAQAGDETSRRQDTRRLNPFVSFSLLEGCSFTNTDLFIPFCIGPYHFTDSLFFLLFYNTFFSFVIYCQEFFLSLAFLNIQFISAKV